MTDDIMGADAQLRQLTDFIMAEVPGEPSRGEGAGETAVRLLRQYRDALRLTAEYLGRDVLPAEPGWSWFDALYGPHPQPIAWPHPADPAPLSDHRSSK